MPPFVLMKCLAPVTEQTKPCVSTGGKQGGICECLNEGFQSPKSAGDGGGAVCNRWKGFGGSSPSCGGAGQTLSRWMC